MSPETSDVVERLYKVLIEEIRTRRPELIDEGFTVAEIYQNLVPYRTHRDRIGTEMNGDYEHALLRLLAGEGEFVELDSDAARERFREELDSLNPDTGVYRNFAACEVQVNEERLPDPGPVEESTEPDPAAPGPAPAASEDGGWLAEVEDRSTTRSGAESAGSDEPAGTPSDAEESGEAAASESGPGLELVEDGPETGSEESPEHAEPGTTCRWCREVLPERDDLQFCPFCGSRVDLVPCPECGTELEEGWLFCLACGTEVGG